MSNKRCGVIFGIAKRGQQNPETALDYKNAKFTALGVFSLGVQSLHVYFHYIHVHSCLDGHCSREGKMLKREHSPHLQSAFSVCYFMAVTGSREVLWHPKNDLMYAYVEINLLRL